ncbi:MAG: transporter [Flavobacteriaceae bacterium]|nr:transporter [Flavobacteriaceae bacterium]
MTKLFSLLFCLFIASNITAQDSNNPSPFFSGGYLPGIMGVRDYANPGTDGLFIIDYNIFLNADSFYDRNGDETTSIDLIPGMEGSIPIDVNISGYINSLMLIYASPKLKFLGNAQYLFIAAPNFTTTSTGVGLGQLTNGNTIDGGASGLGDITVSPFMLSWASEKFDITAGYLFVAPTGKYETGADNNVGIGYWSHMIQAATYYYTSPQKSTAILVMPSYEWHGNLKGANVKPGNRFILEYGISQYLSERLEITLQGGHAWQVGKDSGSDVYWDTNIKDQMSMVAAGVGYWIKPNVFYANAKYNLTYANKQHFKTNIFQIELLIATDFLTKRVKE